ncbi:Meiotic nuclear division protein 1 homolog [Serendipita indica DSM 11827]|nr:Meiotic nuclear division protein 1 homolog [Serendipita indica DSM 11827]
MSVDEKRVKVLSIFHETLKEIEKLASKQGVVEKTVKDIVQSLVADGLVQSDKIGSSNFFWSFPSAQGATLRNQFRSAQEENSSVLLRIKEAEDSIRSEQVMRVPTVEREAALAEFQSLQDEISKLRSELAQYGACDPEQLAQRRTAMRLAKEAAFRWTENVVLARDYVVRQYSLNAEEVSQHFGIKSDFEDLE